jgi:dihydrofolate reductase
MGRITYESIGKPLVDRTNIVMTSNPEFSAPGIHVANSKEQALTIADEHLGSGGRIHIIGGGEVYRQFLENADGMELTVVDAAPEGDVYFPEWDDSEWEIVAATPHPAVPPSPAYEFRSLIRLVT